MVKQFRCAKKQCSGKINIGSRSCPECGKIYGVFGKHEALSKIYEENNYQWQGQNPRDAKIIFIGRDANFANNIADSTYIFNILLEYLKDGVWFWNNSDNQQYWKNRTATDQIQKVHHPFLLPAYSKKDGYTYHSNFSRLNLDSRYSKYISFVEIVSVPTTGYPANDPDDKLKSFIKASAPHIQYLENNMISGDRKGVFISDAAMYALDELNQLSDFYHLMYDSRKMSSKGIPELPKKINNVTIHKCYHFSDPRSRTEEHLEKLRTLIKKYCNLTTAST
jgi:hypothetical protein